MNGIVQIKVKEEVHQLRFNIHGCAEFEQRTFKVVSENPVKIVTDLIYAGMFGEAMRNDLPPKDYGEVCDIVEQLHEEADSQVQIDQVWKTYEESTHGKKFVETINKVADGKKKATA